MVRWLDFYRHQAVKEILVECEENLSTPDKRLDELMHLAELAIEVTQQNEEYHSEVLTNFNSKLYQLTYLAVFSAM